MQLLSILLLLPTVTVAFRPITTSRIIGRLTTKQQLLPDLHDSVNHINTVTEHLQLLQSLQHSLLLSVDETATEAVSAYSKVDKTGFIGFFATYIEIAIDFGRSIFQKVGVQNGYGFSIILFTMLVKLVTLPLTTTQLESTTKMQKLQPLQQKIQAKYANDEQTKNQLMAQLFQSANVNPLAGCFPALVQIPVFISLYRSIQNLVAENKLSEPFLWIPDLEGPTFAKPPSESMDWLKSIATGNPTLGWHDTICFLSLPLILYISQTISQKVLQPPKDPNKVMTEQEQFSQGLVNNLPFIVAFFSINVPAGLAVYWIVNNVLSTLINVVVKNSLKNEEFPVEVAQMMALVDSNASAAKISAVSPKAQELFRPTVVEDRPKVEGFGTPKKDVVDAEIVTDSEHMANESKDEIGDSMTMTENEASNADEGMDSESKKKRKRAKADKRRK